jgi:thiosulfate dehydrogenase
MRWSSFILGLVAAIAVAWAAVSIYFYLGFAPVATHASPMPFEATFAKAALKAAPGSAAQDQSPLSPSEENLVAGARTYRSQCAVCHGLPGFGKTDIQQGEFPDPPALLTGKGVTDDPVGRTHWVVKNGIRMSGMPSFEQALSDARIWQVSLLLANADHLPPAVAEFLKARPN